MRRLLLVLAAIAVLGAVGATAAMSAMSPPKLGKWKLIGTAPVGGGFQLVRGTGKHRSSYYLQKIKGTTATNAVGCPAASTTVTVEGRLKLRTFMSGGYTSWGVGKQDPKATNTIRETPVTVLVDGKRQAGGFYAVWDATNPKLILATGLAVGGCHTYFTYGQHAK
jgi:hypothetical protein